MNPQGFSGIKLRKNCNTLTFRNGAVAVIPAWLREAASAKAGENRNPEPKKDWIPALPQE
jgi:hypothetical protein